MNNNMKNKMMNTIKVTFVYSNLLKLEKIVCVYGDTNMWNMVQEQKKMISQYSK